MQHDEFGPADQVATAPSILLTDTNRWPAPARLAISLSRVGCDVSAVCVTHGHPLLFTRAVRRVFPYSAIRPLESLTAAIEATKPQLIIPCDDRGVQDLHELFGRAQSGPQGARIATLIERSLGSPESYPIVSSRYDLLKIAREERLRVPNTIPIKAIEDLDPWQVEQALPWVLKADGTFGGRGVKIAHNQEQARRFFLEMNRPHRTRRVIKRLVVNRDPFWLRPWWKRFRPPVIAQAYIQGRPANCAIVCWRGKVLAAIGVEVASSEGLTGPATVVRVIENSEMMLAAERIARRLGLSGFFGLDFMIENESGATYLIEMNPRCTPLSHLQLGKSRDLVGALWAQLTGRPCRDLPSVTQKDLIAYFPQLTTSSNEYSQSAFQDIPTEEPELVRELLRPWPERTILFRMNNIISSFQDKSLQTRSPLDRSNRPVAPG
jgi:hypothetical protein